MRHFSSWILLALATVACGARLWLAIAQYQALRLDVATDERALIRATLRSLPETSGAELSVIVDYREVRGGPQRRARLSWHGAPPTQVGETWQLLVTLSGPGGLDNPGGLDAERNALREGIHARARVISSRLNFLVSTAPPGIDHLREQTAAALQARLTEPDSAALAIALAIGDTRGVSPEQWRVFNATGITHLVAISGLHVTLFSVLMVALTRRLWALAGVLQHWRRESFASLCGVTAAAGYALLAGLSVPTQRTLIMLAVWHLMRGLARHSSAVPTIVVALVAVLMIDPLAPWSAGFWLSFVAVAVLIYATPVASGGELDPRALWHTQWRVAVGLLPVTLAIFGSVSLAGLVVNFVAIPLFSFVLVPLLLLATLMLLLCPPLATGLLAVFTWLHGWLWPLLLAAANLPMALWRMQPDSWWYLLALPAVLLWLLPWRLPLRLASLLALTPAIWPRSALLGESEFRITVLDVGRAQAVVVQTRTHTALIDDGESWGSDGALTRSVVIPSLRALGVRQLDLLAMPKLDNDRSAGLVALAAEMPIRRWATAATEAPPEFESCERDARWNWDGVSFEALNAAGCALRISVSEGTAVLLPAELGSADQQPLAASGMLGAAAVVVPRSGAATGYSAALRDASGARYAIFSNSRRGAAARTVTTTMNAWRETGAAILLTGERGAIELRGGPTGLQLHTRR
jgi:competence protein ComEC